MGTERKVIEVFNKWIDCRDAFKADQQCDMRCEECEHNVRAEEMDRAVIAAISALEKQEEDRWIPVTERLPEENGTYLACYEDATVLLDWFNGKWFFYRTNPAVEETGTIIAWRPLPEPYTEEEA